MKKLSLLIAAAYAGLFCLAIASNVASAADATASQPATRPAVDCSTLDGKVMTGYQGWFRTPDDGAKQGWKHWSRDRKQITPASLTVEMWPELSDFEAADKTAVPGFTHPDGQPAYFYSAANPKVVQTHFQWMQQYGIDGAFAQRFLVELGDKSFDRVLENVRSAAASTGRAYGICYDLTGAKNEKLLDMITADWKRLVDEQKVTSDANYIRHNGKPVLFIWGFYSDRFSPELANQVLDFFKNDPKYGATVIGGCQWYWQKEKNADWAKVFRRFDLISPWNVGNVMTVDGKKQAATGYWKTDIAEAQKAGMGYLPVIYPGFGWQNLKGGNAARANISRLGGAFYWRQFATVSDLGLKMAYVAMFDEVDEGTAIFKVSNTPPVQAPFATYEGLPSDWYLRLTGEGGKLLRGETKRQDALPIRP